MIKEIDIENYKSIQKLKLKLGRVTVLIGENGCGKSNILEAIALSAASAGNKLARHATRRHRLLRPISKRAVDRGDIDPDLLEYSPASHDAHQATTGIRAVVRCPLGL